MREVRKQLIEILGIAPEDRQTHNFWVNFIHPTLLGLIEQHKAIIVDTRETIRTTASCMGTPDGTPDGTMEYVIGVVDKQGHPYCLQCGEQDKSIYSPAQLIAMFPDQAHFLIPFFNDHEGIVSLRQSLDG